MGVSSGYRIKQDHREASFEQAAFGCRGGGGLKEVRKSAIYVIWGRLFFQEKGTARKGSSFCI